MQIPHVLSYAESRCCSVWTSTYLYIQICPTLWGGRGWGKPGEGGLSLISQKASVRNLGCVLLAMSHHPVTVPRQSLCPAVMLPINQGPIRMGHDHTRSIIVREPQMLMLTLEPRIEKLLLTHLFSSLFTVELSNRVWSLQHCGKTALLQREKSRLCVCYHCDNKKHKDPWVPFL